jgi:hypothetical protein
VAQATKFPSASTPLLEIMLALFAPNDWIVKRFCLMFYVIIIQEIMQEAQGKV